MHRKTQPERMLALAAALLGLIASGSGQAQTPPPTAPAPAAEPPAAGTPAAAAPAIEADAQAPSPAVEEPAPVAAPVAPAAADDGRVNALEERIAELEAKAEEAEMAALLGDGADEEMEEDPTLRIYGFADFGFQRAWADPSTSVSNFVETDASSFVMGNLNLYFDAKPADAWRTMIEVRFTNAPHGQLNSPGGIAGTFDREDTYQIDPGGSGLNVPMWRGAMVIERAWTEWQAHQLFKIRLGNFFTPWGIWNIDHGSPTLITLNLPQSILQYVFPIRQTGLQIYGSTFAGDWQLGYHATLSNGRSEDSLFDHDDDKAIGARLYAKREMGDFNFAVGGSYYHGNQENEEVNVVDPTPRFEQVATWEYTENIFGLDLSMDIADFRLRSEFTARTRESDAGKLLQGNPLFSPRGTFTPNGTGYWGYLVLAQRLPWWGLEPLIFVDGQQQPSTLGDVILTTAVGLNVHFTPATQLKLNYGQSLFRRFSNKQLNADVRPYGVKTFMARVVTAF